MRAIATVVIFLCVMRLSLLENYEPFNYHLYCCKRERPSLYINHRGQVRRCLCYEPTLSSFKEDLIESLQNLPIGVNTEGKKTTENPFMKEQHDSLQNTDHRQNHEETKHSPLLSALLPSNDR